MAAAQTNNNPLLVLLDLLGSPVLLFDGEAHVVFANQTARSLACRPALVLGSDPDVRQRVRNIAQGLPALDGALRVEVMADTGIVQLDCRCAPRPIAGLVAMSVNLLEPEPTSEPGAAAPAPVADQRLSLQQIMELIRADLIPPIQDALNQTRGAPIPEPLLALKDSLLTLTERLDRMVDLVDVFGEDVLISDERVVVVDMVREAAQELSSLAISKGVTLVLHGEKEDLPPIYGSRKLLRRALLECLHNAIIHSRTEARSAAPMGVEIGFRSSGQHLLVSISNMGALSATLLQRHAASVFRPTLLPDGKPDPAPPVLRIGLPLAQRIMQLHGGRLRIDQESPDELKVMLELPTGAPRRNTHHLDMLQAQIYAEDLSRLLARSRPRKAS
jgi:signal transduction histidine kinase